MTKPMIRLAILLALTVGFSIRASANSQTISAKSDDNTKLTLSDGSVFSVDLGCRDTVSSWRVGDAVSYNSGSGGCANEYRITNKSDKQKVCVTISDDAPNKEHGRQMREWRTAKLISADRKHWVSHDGSTTTGHVDGYGNIHATTSDDTWGHNTYNVAIDDGEYIYCCSRTLNFRWQHDPKFTENANVKWAIDKNDVFVVDDTGREFRMELMKRRKKDSLDTPRP
jgi:hypothetical protein